jgi:predicted nucleotidyltransferase
MQLTAAERRAVDAFCARVRVRFGARVHLLTLFGSRARGDAHPESDIDLCVVVDGLTWQERREVWAIAGDILSEHDVLVSALPMSTEHMNHLRARERAIAEDIAKDGIPL